MRKFTKAALIITVVLVVLGLACLTASFAMGYTWNSFADMVRGGKLSISFGNEEDGDIDDTRIVEEACKSLDIELKAGMLEVYYDDVEHIRVQQKDVRGFRCFVEKDTLYIEGGARLGSNHSGGTVVLVIPQNMIFDEADLEIGAGEANVRGLAANEVHVGVGAGEANITNLDAGRLDAEAGAGQIYAELTGTEEDYNYDVECGIGEVKIGDRSFEGLGKEQNITHSGAKRFLDVECGIGQIQIEFMK